jgi:chemotaxis protein methyltransferase CheR
MPTESDYRYLRQVVFSHSQNVLDPTRDSLFEIRLARLVRTHSMGHIEGLVRYLRMRKDAALETAIAEAMTIDETSFFRDRRPFELLRTDLLPRLIETRRATRTLRFWSAACSTGQEALSLAIVLRERTFRSSATGTSALNAPTSARKPSSVPRPDGITASR